jgi:hypothetical protein
MIGPENRKTTFRDHALVDTAAWNPGKSCRAQSRNGTQICSGFFGYADRRHIQDIAFRYRAASSRNIGSNWLKSMEQAREAPKKLNVFARIRMFPNHGARPRAGCSALLQTDVSVVERSPEPPRTAGERQ